MSLVNDVLRQLDDREVGSRQVLSEPLLTLNSLQIDKSNAKSVSIQRILMGISVLLSSIILLQLFYPKPLSEYFYSKNNSNDISMPISEADNSAFPLMRVLSTQNSVQEELKIPAVKLVKKEPVKDLVINKAEIVKAEALKIEALKIEVLKEEPRTANEPPVLAHTKIRIIEIPGLKEYQLALKAYKKGQNSIAMRWINQAIVMKADEKYLILKSRVFIEQGDGNGLQQFVLNQSNSASLDWFKNIAPGLQMFGFYQLSNQYYSQLVAQQPKQVKWKLAMALNYSKLGLENKSYAIYKSLSNSSLLSKPQKRWIGSQLNRIKSDKVVMNGS